MVVIIGRREACTYDRHVLSALPAQPRSSYYVCQTRKKKRKRKEKTAVLLVPLVRISTRVDCRIPEAMPLDCGPKSFVFFNIPSTFLHIGADLSPPFSTVLIWPSWKLQCDGIPVIEGVAFGYIVTLVFVRSKADRRTHLSPVLHTLSGYSLTQDAIFLLIPPSPDTRGLPSTHYEKLQSMKRGGCAYVYVRCSDYQRGLCEPCE